VDCPLTDAPAQQAYTPNATAQATPALRTVGTERSYPPLIG
jgi:hypothetical protein